MQKKIDALNSQVIEARRGATMRSAKLMQLLDIEMDTIAELDGIQEALRIVEKEHRNGRETGSRETERVPQRNGDCAAEYR